MRGTESKNDEGLEIMKTAIIKYKCPHCSWDKAKVRDKRGHLITTCCCCHKYIRHISKAEFEKAYIFEFTNSESVLSPLEEINFKLDTIINYLNKKEKQNEI